MPSSYLSYAVDFDGDGKRDIWNNETDAIGSVANYFKRHGWKRDFPVTLPAGGVDPHRHARFLNGKLKPAFTLGELRKAGMKFNDLINDRLKAALITLDTDKGKEYWLGLDNFYTITRYNHSPMYAMAVWQLGNAILEAP
jgi:membrane-bound lytic murein transglycosylase B